MKKYLPKIHMSTWLYLGLCFYCRWYKESLLLMAIILFHEYCHVLVSFWYGYEIEEITLYPFGAFLKMKDDGSHEIHEDLKVALAGCVGHLFLLGISPLFKQIFGWHLYRYYLQFNLQILCFNLLPIDPMDGSKILQCLLSYFLDYLLCIKINLYISLLAYLVFLKMTWDLSYSVIYLFLAYRIYCFSQDYYYRYLTFLIQRKPSKRRKEVMHTKPILLRNKQNYYLFKGQILDEKTFIKSRFFIDNSGY